MDTYFPCSGVMNVKAVPLLPARPVRLKIIEKKHSYIYFLWYKKLLKCKQKRDFLLIAYHVMQQKRRRDKGKSFARINSPSEKQA